jgi:hypothetical protein
MMTLRLTMSTAAALTILLLLSVGHELEDGLSSDAGPRRIMILTSAQQWRTGTEQVLTVNNERFMVPEALFHPSDIGMDQAGAPHTS